MTQPPLLSRWLALPRPDDSSLWAPLPSNSEKGVWGRQLIPLKPEDNCGRHPSMRLGVSLNPRCYSLWYWWGCVPSTIFKMSRQVKREAFIIFLLVLFLFGGALGVLPPPLCVFKIEYNHRCKLSSRLPAPAEAAFRTSSRQEAADAQSRPWAPCPVCAHWIESDHLQWHPSFFLKSVN